MGTNVTLANLAEEIIFIVLVIFSILRIDLRRMPNSLSLPDEFRTCVIVWREASILNIFSLQFLPVKILKYVLTKNGTFQNEAKLTRFFKISKPIKINIFHQEFRPIIIFFQLFLYFILFLKKIH